MAVDSTGFRRKMDLLRKFNDDNVINYLNAAAFFVVNKLVDEVLAGQEGFDYPKDYPSSVKEGETGFIGIVTNRLRDSMGYESPTQFQRIIKQTSPSLAPYFRDATDHVKNRYGIGIMEITIQLYGEEVLQEAQRMLSKAIQDIKNGNLQPYKSGFAN